MPLVVTSAFGVNGDGYGALLAFDRNGAPLGAFCNDPRIFDSQVARPSYGVLPLIKTTPD